MTQPGPPQAFTEARRFAWLRLWRSENVGPRTFDTLLTRFGSAEAALDALPELSRRLRPGRPIGVATGEDVEREIATAARFGARFLCRDEPGYPTLLREIADPPAVIAVRGDAEVLGRPAIAIVGARNASAAGLAFTERLARNLGQAGYLVVSGFARGIDSRAHRSSFPTGTVAVLAGGHDRLYPAGQQPMMEQLLERGASLSEMPFGWEARGRDFPRRNRLVSGLSLGVVVVEAARRSGSLITARFAADQGRDVFAVPGSPLDPRAEGTNDLLRDGAIFCTSADDVIQALADRRPGTQTRDVLADAPAADTPAFWDELDFSGALPCPEAAPPVSPQESLSFRETGIDHDEDKRPALDRVAERLGPAPVSIDELARSVDLPIRAVRGAVLELEIAGRVERHGGGLVSLIMP